jgi:hypothetical protein
VRVVAIGVGLGLPELQTAHRDPFHPLALAAAAEGRAISAFASGAGSGAGWWVVDRAGRVIGRGSGERPGPGAFRGLVGAAQR